MGSDKDDDRICDEEELVERVPVRVTKGDTTNTGLSFNLEPGAILAHPGSAVVFVCG